ncbi:MAG: RtcB family protein [Tissierellia bacterium]|nr:RtcB family protein [Tissierellia bacterium]
MIINGKYAEAKVYGETIDEGAISQIENLCNQAFVEGSKIRIMPDVHAGIGSTIGTTMTITDKLVPNLVGVDIGCGIEAVKLKNKHIELERLDKIINSKVPAGFEIRKVPHAIAGEIDLSKLRATRHANLKLDRAYKSLGTLGGGNHFIEVNKDDEGDLYLVVHSGSRHLGVEIAGFYQRKAYDALNKRDTKDVEDLINKLKAEGREKEIQKALKELRKTVITEVPKDLAYLEGENFDDYIHDMKIVQEFAVLNRKAIVETIERAMKLDVEWDVTTIHNYIDTENMILRKGAVSAKKGEVLLIPINMRDGSLICEGLGNPDWNESAPHGAGRLMSRNQSKNEFTLSEFKKQMDGIYTTSVNEDTLDECPMAYKDMEEIVNNISDTAKILKVIKPIYNFKAGENKPRGKRKRNK